MSSAEEDDNDEGQEFAECHTEEQLHILRKHINSLTKQVQQLRIENERLSKLLEKR